jgi:hypothetical protein
MDIYKCPKSISLFTFGKLFVIEKTPYKYTYNFVTLYRLKIIYVLIPEISGRTKIII